MILGNGIFSERVIGKAELVFTLIGIPVIYGRNVLKAEGYMFFSVACIVNLTVRWYCNYKIE